MKPFATLADAPKIARQFVQYLFEDLGYETLKLIAEKNANESDSSICHSHDYCDANMTMDRALSDAGFISMSEASDGMQTDDDADAISEKIIPVWGAAWDIALRAGFIIDDING